MLLQSHLPIHATAGILVAIGLLVGLPKLRGTTLVAPTLWAILSAVTIGASEGLIGIYGSDHSTHFLWQSAPRFATGVPVFVHGWPYWVRNVLKMAPGNGLSYRCGLC